MDTLSIMLQKARSEDRHPPVQTHHPSTQQLSLRLDMQHVDAQQPSSDANLKQSSTLTTAAISTKPLPLPDVQIPNIRRGPEAWKEAVKQWEEGDPDTGFKALKDWPEEWYTGSQRLHFATKRSQRRVIADEYRRYVTVLYMTVAQF
jgi:hypothetical protein